MVQFITTPPCLQPTQQPSGRLYINGFQNNIVNNTNTKILLDTVDPLFTDGIEDTVNHWILPGVAGYYLFSASIGWESGIDGFHYDLNVYAGPVPKLIGIDQKGFSRVAGGANVMTCHASDVIPLLSTQHIYITAQHWDGTNLPDIQPGPVLTYLTVQRVR